MPPFLPRKRLASTPPPFLSNITPPRKRPKLVDVLDTDPGHAADLEAARNFTLGDDESGSSLSDIDSDEFEDVSHVKDALQASREDKEDPDEDISWEDAMAEDRPPKRSHVPMEGGSLELNLSRNADDIDEYDLARAAASTKKGPTKIERQIRLQTHCMHVQYLLYHNAIRNRWVCDKEVQEILVQQLPLGITKEIQKWRAASGLESKRDLPAEDAEIKSKDKRKLKRPSAGDDRNQRDWGRPSGRLENGKPDLSRGDPIIHLLKVLAAYWKKRFTITAPGLRKIGYASAAVRRRQINSFRSDKHDPDKHGERIASLADFRRLARRCEGSRDVGAQLFTALLRGLGITSRLVASLQPSGFGWTKSEQAEMKKPLSGNIVQEVETGSSAESDQGGELVSKHFNNPNQAKRGGRVTAKRKAPSRKLRGKGEKDNPVDLDTSSVDESTSTDPGEKVVVNSTRDAPSRKLSRYDRDLPFPIYWTEVISPITSTVVPVSPLVLANPVAATPELLAAFEPRGAKAEKAKQVIAYVVAYSADDSAKDVTTRYLKRRMWPGKTKGFRIPVKKIPIYNKRGKVLRYEGYDWFKSAMSGYGRAHDMRTAVDDMEDSTDLAPQRLERKENQQGGDTLQSLKSSAEFVLERFLRREEALKPSAKPVRTFSSGKGDKLKEENVYRRADVERCLSAESWHKEGRQVKEREAPLKLVPIRAVTLTRKREVEEMQRQTGEKPTQGLYSRNQTEYIIPPAIKDGVIPKNAYGNIDCFVPSMVPKGAVHIPMRGTKRICRKLEIDFAEAVTGFEFGNKLAVPVVEGVVVAAEHEQAVRDGWDEYAEQQRVKEQAQFEKTVLGLWKKMLMGLRIRERVSDTYGGEEELDPADDDNDDEVLDSEDMHGDLVLRDDDALLEGGDAHLMHGGGGGSGGGGGGFLLPHEDAGDDDDDDDDDDDGDELAGDVEEIAVEHDGGAWNGRKHARTAHYPTPVSTSSSTGRRSTRNRNRKPIVIIADSASQLSDTE